MLLLRKCKTRSSRSLPNLFSYSYFSTLESGTKFNLDSFRKTRITTCFKLLFHLPHFLWRIFFSSCWCQFVSKFAILTKHKVLGGKKCNQYLHSLAKTRIPRTRILGILIRIPRALTTLGIVRIGLFEITYFKLIFVIHCPLILMLSIIQLVYVRKIL